MTSDNICHIKSPCYIVRREHVQALVANRFCASWTRCRELVLDISIAHPHQTHFDINIAVDALWNLRENLRYLLALHREGQRQFARQQTEQKAKAQKLKEKNDAATLVKISNFRA